MIESILKNRKSIIATQIAKRNVGIDVLRGVCILAVILLHLNIHLGFTQTFLKDFLPKKLFTLFFWNGYNGVVVFFTISGFLITSSIIKKWGELSEVSLKGFYGLRFARIIPLLCVLLVILALLHLSGVEGFVIDTAKTSLPRAIIAALTFHLNWLEIQVGYLPANWDVLWSISIEESFYLFFPWVCLFLKKEWHFVLVLLLFLFVSPWARTQMYPGSELGSKNHLAFLDAIAFGCMTAIVAHRVIIPKLWNKCFLWLGWSLIVMVFVFKSFVYKSGLVALGLDMTLQSIGVSFVLLWMYRNQVSGKQKNRRLFNWLRHMGIYSYEIYLTHMFVILFGTQIFNFWELEEAWLVPYSMVLIVVSYFIGKITFNYFSEPLNMRLRASLGLSRFKKFKR